MGHETASSVIDRAFALPIHTPPMEAKTRQTLPEGQEWQFEPKWDGFRCLAFKRGPNVELRAKSGKSLGRFFPEMLAAFKEVDVDDFVLDGELVIEVNGHLAFDALQMRLHPAESRIRKLSTETPARFIAFDILAEPGKALIGEPLSTRRERLGQLMATIKPTPFLHLSPMTHERQRAETWLNESGPNGTDGVVAKRLDAPYVPGERAMIKVKRLRTADCVVGGFRYESDSNEVGSLLLGLYDHMGKLHHVGFTSTITDDERSALTERITALRGPPGFTGKAPGGPSRWSAGRSGEWEPLSPVLVVEVRFDHVTGCRFRHGTKLLRWRADKRPDQCRFDQIES